MEYLPLGEYLAEASVTNISASSIHPSWQDFITPPHGLPKRTLPWAQLPHCFLASCYCDPTYFKKHTSLNTHFPLCICSVLSGFVFLHLCLWNTITSGQGLVISLALDPLFLVYLLFRAILWTSARSLFSLLWLIMLINTQINHAGLCSEQRNAVL